jgi:hypothetical protein
MPGLTKQGVRKGYDCSTILAQRKVQQKGTTKPVNRKLENWKLEIEGGSEGKRPKQANKPTRLIRINDLT